MDGSFDQWLGECTGTWINRHGWTDGELRILLLLLPLCRTGPFSVVVLVVGCMRERRSQKGNCKSHERDCSFEILKSYLKLYTADLMLVSVDGGLAAGGRTAKAVPERLWILC